MAELGFELRSPNLQARSLYNADGNSLLNKSLPTLNNGEGTGAPIQYSCLENPMDRGGW